MSIETPFGGQEFAIPEVGDTGWGPPVTGYLEAISQFAFQNPADFSNAVLALRQYFQTITPNGPTLLTAIPNGTSTAVALQLYSDPLLTNGSTFFFGTDGSVRNYISSGHLGSGTTLPIDFLIDGTTQLRISPNGHLLINTLTDNGAELQVNGSISFGTVISGDWQGNPVAIAHGGTGATTSLAAIDNLLPSQGGNSGKVLSTDGTNPAWLAVGGTGTVTSVGLADASNTPIFGITNSPVTASGTLTETLLTQTANTIFAGPASGGAAQPTFRAAVPADFSGVAVSSLTGTANQIAVSAATGPVTISIPSNVILPIPTSGNYALTLNGNAATSNSFGLKINAGTNTSDAALAVDNASGSPMLTVNGNGNVTIANPVSGISLRVNGTTGANVLEVVGGTEIYAVQIGSSITYAGTISNTSTALMTNNISRLTINNTGNVTINAPSSGIALTVSDSVSISGTYRRSAAGVGYLDGGYSSIETSTTSGAIYSIGGGSFIPGTTTLGTMYGIGYCFSSATLIAGVSVPAGHWGQYVAAAGSATIFLDASNSTVYAASFVGSGSSLTNIPTSIHAGTGISVSAATGSVTIGNTGVTTVNGLTGAVTVPANATTPVVTTVGTAGTIGSSQIITYPSGFIEASGITSTFVPGGSAVAFSFPTAFPSVCYNIQITSFGNGANAFAEFSVNSYSRTGFVLYNNSGGGTPYTMWRATGK